MLLTYLDLVDLVEDGVLAPVEPSQINAASIDVRLGDRVLVEDVSRARVVDLAAKEGPPLIDVPLPSDGFWALRPGEFCLAHTREVFHLPADICAEFKLKSSLARAGLGHALAGFCDPGWTGSVLTLELRNDLEGSVLLLRPGMPIGQMVFFRGQAVPEHASYARRGQYNHDTSVQPTRGVR